MSLYCSKVFITVTGNFITHKMKCGVNPGELKYKLLMVLDVNLLKVFIPMVCLCIVVIFLI